MKKIFAFILFTCFTFVLVACTEDITTITTTTTTEEVVINVDTNSITMIEKQTYQLEVTSNDEIGLIYSVDTAGVINLSDTGFITAVSEGYVTVKVTSRTNEDVYQEIIVNVRKEILLTSNHLTVDVTEGDTHQLVITSNDEYTFTVANESILTVDTEGLITARSEGTTTITVRSTYDTEKSIVITVNVDKLITIDVNKSEYVLVVGDTETLDVSSNDGLTFLSGNQNVVTVNQDGLLEAIGFGTTTVRITSTYDDTVQENVTITVYKYTEEISIDGDELLIEGMESQLDILTNPAGALDTVTWESSDESVLTVSEFGVVTALSSGSATVIAKSILDESIADTFNITVVNMLVVDASKVEGDTYLYQTLELNYGEQLFSSLTQALDAAKPDTIIYVEAGTYQENITIDISGINIIGISETAIIDGIFDLQADDIYIANLVFENTSKITNSIAVSNFKFEDNTVQNITDTQSAFISLNDITNIDISNNSLLNLAGNAIDIVDFKGLNTNIIGNTIDTCLTAISLDANTTLDPSSQVKIYWNKIYNTSLAFDIDMLVDSVEQDIFKAARFNDVSDYVQAANVNVGSEFDFTLNYWGQDTIDETKFTNVDSMYLKGNYAASETMPTETSYNPALPVIINITNPISEIMIGETHTFEYEILPYELASAPVKFITGIPGLVAINQEGMITPLSSGDAYIQIRSAQVSTIRTQINFSIITTPGIEITSTDIYSDVVVGDTFTLETILFPYTIENETATISSSAPLVASIDSNGLVTTHGEGLVTFTATLDSDANVSVDYTIYVHGLLDPENNLLDYLTTQQISYSTIHEWTAFGFQYDYHDRRAESVSRYYFDEISINDSKMVPVTEGIRPGEPMDPHPDGVTPYNPYNVYWIVVHDTASTATGSNALAHANYLYNNAILGTQLWTSWHFSIDDHDVYQHLPEIERGYHAGDGSTLPLQGTTYLGGGNRNGIGIEMCINDDGDMYRTWQRTAKLVTYLLEKYTLPLDNYKYHVDFSGKDCPRTLRNAGLVPVFEEFVAAEYYIKMNYPNATISLTSNNPEYLDNAGRIIKIPDRALTVSYTITVTDNGVTESRTFYTYLPGTVR